jgi:tetratricopeptide (TPR) repeat protein
VNRRYQKGEILKLHGRTLLRKSRRSCYHAGVRFVPLIAVFCLTTGFVLSRPIEFEVGRGRNMNAVKLVDQAQDQLFKKDDLAGARQSVDAAIRADPTYWPALFIRAEILMEQHHYAAALQDCEAVLKQDSTVVEAALLRAKANLFLGRYAASMKEIEHCITIRPRQDALARAYETRALLRLYCPDPSIRNAQKAVSDATTACKLMAWTDGELIDVVATAEAATGNFDSASRHEQQAMGATKVREDEKREYQKHLARFQQHKTLSGTAQ